MQQFFSSTLPSILIFIKYHSVYIFSTIYPGFGASMWEHVWLPVACDTVEYGRLSGASYLSAGGWP